uniref:Deoxycytidine deaminase n=1 Tax=Canis lupus dingo TaxID=286419 RepID=A0A8C0JQW1_CANLU
VHRHLLDENTFTQNFRNDHNPSKTYLCYQVELSDGSSGVLLDQDKDIWFLLEHIRSRNLDQKLSYKVTCFLSWTPCEKCAKEIIRFLAKNRHVSLSILASRIYTMGPYVKGLRELYDAGVHISIMTFRDFEYCWQTFVDHQDSPFQPWADLDRRSQQLSQQLRAILQVRSSLPPAASAALLPPVVSLDTDRTLGLGLGLSVAVICQASVVTPVPFRFLPHRDAGSG